MNKYKKKIHFCLRKTALVVPDILQNNRPTLKRARENEKRA